MIRRTLMGGGRKVFNDLGLEYSNTGRVGIIANSTAPYQTATISTNKLEFGKDGYNILGFQISKDAEDSEYGNIPGYPRVITRRIYGYKDSSRVVNITIEHCYSNYHFMDEPVDPKFSISASGGSASVSSYYLTESNYIYKDNTIKINNNFIPFYTSINFMIPQFDKLVIDSNIVIDNDDDTNAGYTLYQKQYFYPIILNTDKGDIIYNPVYVLKTHNVGQYNKFIKFGYYCENFDEFIEFVPDARVYDWGTTLAKT